MVSKKIVKKIVVTFFLIAGLLLVIILNPVLTYANKTSHRSFDIYHNKTLDPAFSKILDSANSLVMKSELFDASLRLQVCLNDGSFYNDITKTLLGKAFARGFYNKVVLYGKADFQSGYVELKGYRWNLVQLLAHEMIHCHQYNRLGFWHSNPWANIPAWKWEGYCEYISRKNNEKDLSAAISRLLNEKHPDGWITFRDGTGTVISYFESWLLMRYCMDIRKMSYRELLKDMTAKETIKNEMQNWYNKSK